MDENVFLFAANAVLPLLLLIGLGYCLKKIKFFSPEFLSTANRFCFYVALPVLLFKNLYDSKIDDMPWKLIIFIVIAIITIFLLGLLYAVIFVRDNSQKGVMIQGIMRSNYAFIGIPLVTALFSEGTEVALKAGTTVALVSIFCIPLFNILSVVALSIFTGSKANFKKIIIGICKNPLIIGILIGILVLVFRMIVPSSSFVIKNNVPFLYKVISNIASVASPLALIVLGGQFEFSVIKKIGKLIISGVIGRTIIVPFVVFSIALLLNKFENYEFATMVALFSSPVAIVSAVMAKEMDNDYILAGQLVVWTTLISSVTIFITIIILKALGCL